MANTTEGGSAGWQERLSNIAPRILEAYSTRTPKDTTREDSEADRRRGIIGALLAAIDNADLVRLAALMESRRGGKKFIFYGEGLDGQGSVKLVLRDGSAVNNIPRVIPGSSDIQDPRGIIELQHETLNETTSFTDVEYFSHQGDTLRAIKGGVRRKYTPKPKDSQGLGHSSRYGLSAGMDFMDALNSPLFDKLTPESIDDSIGRFIAESTHKLALPEYPEAPSGN
ncbi:MAG: hypothetical protein WBO77_00755 [Microgenomates group bacterium]